MTNSSSFLVQDTQMRFVDDRFERSVFAQFIVDGVCAEGLHMIWSFTIHLQRKSRNTNIEVFKTSANRSINNTMPILLFLLVTCKRPNPASREFSVNHK